MLSKFLESLCAEFSIFPLPKRNEKGVYPFRLNEEIEVALTDLEPGVSMQAKIGPCPGKRREDLFIFLMRANLLGQGTAGARLGIEADEKTLTLSLGLPYEMDYKALKENFEDFVNSLLYWREEIAKFEEQESIL